MPRKTKPKPAAARARKPTLLAGGNPQISKADGETPVQAYIAAMPVTPGASKHKEVRYLDIREDELDEKQLAAWLRQASALPGWVP